MSKPPNPINGKWPDSVSLDELPQALMDYAQFLDEHLDDIAARYKPVPLTRMGVCTFLDAYAFKPVSKTATSLTQSQRRIYYGVFKATGIGQIARLPPYVEPRFFCQTYQSGTAPGPVSLTVENTTNSAGSILRLASRTVGDANTMMGFIGIG